MKDRILATRSGRVGSATILPPEGTVEQQWSRAFFLKLHSEGFHMKELQEAGESSQTSGVQGLKPQQAAEAKAVLEPELDLEQGSLGEVEELEK